MVSTIMMRPVRSGRRQRDDQDRGRAHGRRPVAGTVSLPSAGRWSMDLQIKLAENDEVTIAAPILIR